MRISYIFKAWPEEDVLRDCSKEELALLILLYKNGSSEEKELCEALDLRPARVQGALRYLLEEGLIQQAEDGVACEFSARAGEIFEARGGKEIAAGIRDHALAALLEECAALLRKPVLERWEIEDITCLYEQYGLGEEFIVSLLADMRSRSACSVKALVNRAIGLHKQGIDSHEALMRYFEEREEKGEYERTVRRVLGIGGRLSDAERTLFAKWVQTFGFGEEMLKKAYDLTTMQLGGKRSYEYMDSILTNWYNAGIFSPADADAAGEKYKNEHAGSAEAPAAQSAPQTRRKKETPRYGNFDTMDAFARALERSYGADTSENDEKSK
jgi:DnaD/phage-associated family protein